MPRHVEPLHYRPRSEQDLDALFSGGWPAFITADQVVTTHIRQVRELFADLELVVLDEEDVPVAAGWAVPIPWGGEPAELPSGYTGALVQAVTENAEGIAPDTLVVMAAQVHPERRGQGLAGELLMAMRALAAERSWPRVIAPVRPTLKARYPLTAIERFAAWTRPDGSPLDPWLRTHHRLGAAVIGTAPRSQVMTGTVRQWEEWTGLVFPDSGNYVIPEGLAVLTIDRSRGTGVYLEPNVWMRHS